MIKCHNYDKLLMQTTQQHFTNTDAGETIFPCFERTAALMGSSIELFLEHMSKTMT